VYIVVDFLSVWVRGERILNQINTRKMIQSQADESILINGSFFYFLSPNSPEID